MKNMSAFRYMLIIGSIAGLIFISACSSPDNPKRFRKLVPSKSGFDFTNTITEDSVYNALDFTNIYTGSGVGIGDFNQDGLPDIFMGACMTESKLFLNKGQMQFQDVSHAAGIRTDRWITGVNIVDINQDNWPDIYLSVSGPASSKRENLLYINQQDGTFKEEAKNYGINESKQCTQASFTDYDKDGDLDLFLAVNPTDYAIYDVNTIRKRKVNGEGASTDILYRNNGDGTFTNISSEAGILIEGYSLGLNVSDVNQDGWPDIYVANDFLSNDILYINQQNGTFSNQADKLLKHTSFASMGIDIADLNNDGQLDIYVLDMFPEEHYREKMIMPGADYNRFRYILNAGYDPQYSRNTLQLQNRNGTFSEVGQLAGVHKTDWSWSALLADFDNDGKRDIFVANGFLKDIGDLDYINYNRLQVFGSKEVIRQRQLEQIKAQESIKIPNYLFQNKGDLNFSNVASLWGLGDSTCSNGAAYADLDLDGDLDLVINNLNQASDIYENLSRDLDQSHYLGLQLHSKAPNLQGFGSKIWLYTPQETQYYEHNPYRGYESSIGPNAHFGLGTQQKIDSIAIVWPNGNRSVYYDPPIDTLLLFTEKQNKNSIANHVKSSSPKPDLFKPVKALHFTHQEDIYADFYQHVLLPHQFNKLGPALATGDLNGDQLDDVFIGASAGNQASLFLQSSQGKWEKRIFAFGKEFEDVDATFFDVEGDGDLDLYVVSGGTIGSNNTEDYQDRLYLNDGQANFSESLTALPEINSSGSRVRPFDYDSDGDLDLFVGGRVTPGKYPEIPTSYLLENQKGKFLDVTAALAPGLQEVGMVSDAQWTDVNGDGLTDLMLVGEWMPITYFQFDGSRFKRFEAKGLSSSNGWWNCIKGADFDQDGDIDFIVGNLGLNTNYKASRDYPVCLYTKDFDQNGTLDPILCQFIDGIEYPVADRDLMVRQLVKIKERFPTYDAYANATFASVFPRENLKNAQILKSHVFESCYLENMGEEGFKLEPLDWELQLAPIQDIHIEDINNDGLQDALLIGNAYNTEVKTGRYDAFTGACLLGKKEGKFKVLRGSESGFFADKDARKLGKINSIRDGAFYIVANNADSLQFFQKRF